MTSPSKPKGDKLYWLKYNPNEWHGMYSELSDEEYGLFHRVVAKLWSTPGNRLTLDQLTKELRLRPKSPRAETLRGLVGYALMESEDGIYVTAVDDAFAGAVVRSNKAKTAAEKRHQSRPSTAQPMPHDF